MNWLTDSGAWTTIINANLWQATLAAAIPLSLPAVGAVICERSGVVNIAMEGMMLVGAFVSVAIDILTHNAAIGMLAALVIGVVISLVHAFSAIKLRVDQIVSGMAINL